VTPRTIKSRRGPSRSAILAVIGSFFTRTGRRLHKVPLYDLLPGRTSMFAPAVSFYAKTKLLGSVDTDVPIRRNPHFDNRGYSNLF
jgi:hypothetical protein